MTKAQRAEQAEAIEQLRGWIKPGDTVYTILDHVSTSASGMSQAIRVVLPTITGNRVDGVGFIHLNWAVGKALQLRHWKRNGWEQDALVMGGCGMDMGFHLVYELSSALYGGRLHRDIYMDDSPTINKDGTGELLTRAGAPEGYVYIGGYACLGKGKCPSNYHVNHHDTIRCEGTRQYNPEGPDTGRFCWKPDRWFRADVEIPEDWPRAAPIDLGEGAMMPGHLLTVVSEDGAPYEVCPTCKGEGHLPNPEGPERWDLVHTDGYALRHRWL